MKAKWIKFRISANTGKTLVWDVLTVEGDEFLGTIKWFGRWRTYAYHTLTDNGSVVLEPTCLRDIAQFIEDEMNKRKNK